MLNLLMSSILGRLFAFVKNKHRLIIEYILIGIIVTTAGLTFTLWLGKLKVENKLAEAKTELAQLTGKVKVLESVNDLQQKSIDDLIKLRAKDSKIMTGLLDQFAGIGKTADEKKKAIKSLGEKNESIAKYLNSIIPDELINSLCKSGTCADSGANENREGEAKRGVVPTVHKTER